VHADKESNNNEATSSSLSPFDKLWRYRAVKSMEDAVFPVKGITATITTATMNRNDNEGTTRKVRVGGLSSVNPAIASTTSKFNAIVSVDGNVGREQPPPNDTTESIYDQMRSPTITKLEQEVILYDDYQQSSRTTTNISFEEKLDDYYNNDDTTDADDGDTIPFDEMGMDEEQSILDDFYAEVETGEEVREEAEGFVASLFRWNRQQQHKRRQALDVLL